MIFYLKGKVTELYKNKIVLEVNNIGYLINVIDETIFNVDENIKIYIFEYNIENNNELYGFKSKYDLALFISLNKVTGIGVKTAIKIIGKISYEDFIRAIKENDLDLIKSLPGISDKSAISIIKELNKTSNKKKIVLISKDLIEINKGLINLGFKVSEIKPILASVDTKNKSKEDIFKECLRRLRK